MFMIDLNKGPQTSYAIFSTQKSHGDELVLRAQELIESDGAGVGSVEDLAGRLAASRRSLERRFKSATGNTILQYIQRVKVEQAKKELEATTRGVQEIVREVGYDDVPSFRRLFVRLTGMTPSRYRQMYSRAGRRWVEAPARVG
jgi:transcriptional regulator GlxA family with amidase domain